MSPAFWLEVAVAALLVATIAYCFVLNRRLQQLRSAQSDMAALMRDFTNAMQQAESGLGELRAVGRELGGELDARIGEARDLLDELSIMVDSGSGLADRIERGLLGAGAGAGSGTPLRAAAEATGGAAQAPSSVSERELAEAMRRPR